MKITQLQIMPESPANNPAIIALGEDGNAYAMVIHAGQTLTDVKWTPLPILQG